MSYTRYISSDFYSVSKTHTCDFTESRVRLLRCNCINTRTNSAALWVLLKCRGAHATPLVLSAVTYKLAYCWQIAPSFPINISFYFLRSAAAAVFLVTAQALPNCNDVSAHSTGTPRFAASVNISAFRGISASLEIKILLTPSALSFLRTEFTPAILLDEASSFKGTRTPPVQRRTRVY